MSRLTKLVLILVTALVAIAARGTGPAPQGLVVEPATAQLPRTRQPIVDVEPLPQWTADGRD